MGCGMAVRRAAIERVGPFDERMLNYYDDVDYGVRLWRAGYRVAVADGAWIDHGFGQSGGGEPARKLLWCERHRMRVVLKHAALGELGRWAGHEARALRDAEWARRGVKLRAIAWNARHLASALAARRALRGAAPVPERLVDPSWGEGFPAGVPPRARPRPETASNAIEMADPRSEGRLPYGWFPAERVAGRSYRWAAAQAGALIRLDAPARRLRLDYAHVPVNTGGVDVAIRRLGSPEPLALVWAAHLRWQHIERSVENHPLELPPGDYEVVFSAPRGWSDPPREIRSLGFALASMSFEESWDLPPGGVDLASPASAEQLLGDWFEAERSGGRGYRWATAHAAAVVRLDAGANGARLSYRFPPGPTAGLSISIRPVNAREAVWSTLLEWRAGEWREETLELRLPAGDYVVAFDAEATWSNPDGRDPELPPENRALGFALSSLSFRET